MRRECSTPKQSANQKFLSLFFTMRWVAHVSSLKNGTLPSDAYSFSGLTSNGPRTSLWNTSKWIIIMNWKKDKWGLESRILSYRKCWSKSTDRCTYISWTTCCLWQLNKPRVITRHGLISRLATPSCHISEPNDKSRSGYFGGFAHRRAWTNFYGMHVYSSENLP